MSWIQDNKGPAAVLGLTGAGVIGLGVMLFNAWSGASAAQEEFDMVNVSLSRLKSTPLAPTNDNLAKKQQIVQAYETAVGKLSLVLYKLQPEDKPTSNTEFQAKLKSRIAEIKNWAAVSCQQSSIWPLISIPASCQNPIRWRQSSQVIWTLWKRS